MSCQHCGQPFAFFGGNSERTRMLAVGAHCGCGAAVRWFHEISFATGDVIRLVVGCSRWAFRVTVQRQMRLPVFETHPGGAQ